MVTPILRSDHALVRGVRVHYREGGEGPALLLVHGFLVDHRAFRHLIPRLVPHFRVIAPDLPGFGLSERPPHYGYTREAWSETLYALLEHLGVPSANVVGHSLGGAVALTLAADHPDAVERAAVINCAAWPFHLPLLGALSFTPVLGRVLFKHVYGREVFEAFFREDVYSHDRVMDHAQVDAWYDLFRPPEARECALRALRATVDVSSLAARIRRVKAPTLVIAGDRDRLFSIDHATRLAHELPDARLEVLYRAAHAPHEEQPEAVAELLLRHFVLEG